MSDIDLENIVNPSVDAPADFPEIFNANNQEIIDYLKGISATQSVLNQTSVANTQGILSNTNLINTEKTNILNKVASDKDYILTTVATISSNNYIGLPNDGTYTDGYFTELTGTTSVSEALDKINELLKVIAPKQAPSISDISFNTQGKIGAVSFGGDNPIFDYNNGPLGVNTLIDNTGNSRGILALTFITGKINSQVGATDSYDQYAIGNGDSGLLKLLVNGSVIQQYDLGEDLNYSGNRLNLNGSGFTNLSIAKSILVNGVEFPSQKYRTSNWNVAVEDLVKGYNTIQIQHTGTWGTYSTPLYSFVIDASTTSTYYSNNALTNYNPSGSKYISGINYNTGGTIDYTIDVSGIYRNTYSKDLIYVEGTYVSNQTQSIPFIDTGASEDELKIVNVNKNMVVNSTNTRILGGSISVRTKASRTVQSETYSTYTNMTGALIDNIENTSTSSDEKFEDETYRMIDISSPDYTNTNYNTNGSSDFDWDNTEDLHNNNGLLVFNGRLQYPTNTSGSSISNGNFSALANGPINPDYSDITGNVTYYRHFSFNPVTRAQNFVIITESNSTVFVSTNTSLINNNVYMEVLVPNVTSVNGVVGFKDAYVDYAHDESLGIYFGNILTGTIYENNINARGYSLGQKNSLAGNDVLVVKITAPSTWLGYINRIQVFALT